jgi:hypothetical protein
MTTPHTCNDGRPPVFGRLKPKECPRCFELSVGAPRVEWAGTRKAQADARFLSALKAHSCSASGCLPICTFGDW